MAFTEAGRQKGARVRREASSNWPKVTTTAAKAFKGRRFDEPGGIVKLKPTALWTPRMHAQ